MSAPILVIGATGRHAATGTVVDRLLSRGRPVRALVRSAHHLRQRRADRGAGLMRVGVEPQFRRACNFAGHYSLGFKG
jgi:uncharacterized protein YbjT (DUF2867 family)